MHQTHRRVFMAQKETPSPRFSFVYGGKTSDELLPTWEQTTSPDGKHTWADTSSGLRVDLELNLFETETATEWVLRFTNTGSDPTLILEQVRVLDAGFQVAESKHALPSVTLGRSRGSRFAINDFEYQEEVILPDERVDMVAGNGRPSQNWLPFFDLDFGGYGWFTAIGWSGQWATGMHHGRDGILRVTGGMETFRAYLEPGESVRTPRVLLMAWSGDKIAAHNKLRRFLRENHTPRIEGQLVTGPFTMGSWGAMNTDEQIRRLEIYRREKVRQEYFWLDAGWYGADSSYSPDEFEGDWGDFVGDWSVNLTRHPKGLGPIRDAAAAAGMKFLLWAEPGRAIASTPIVTEHPDWFLGDGRERLLDLGNPEAREGAADIFSSLITENQVDLYREDYNINPLPYWDAANSPGRDGVAEAHYVEGFYWFWDELLRRHPGLIIDNCASGGRRIELETIGRSLALWRSDWQCYPDADPAGAQNHGMGLSMWIPNHGGGLWASMPTAALVSKYRIRSAYGPSLQMSAFVRESQPVQEDYPWDQFREMSDEYLRARPFYTGDYYPLTPIVAVPQQTFVAYQMHRPDLSAGMVLAFRRKESEWEGGRFELGGLKPEANYELHDVDVDTIRRVTGVELTAGLQIDLTEPESSAIYFYKEIVQ